MIDPKIIIEGLKKSMKGKKTYIEAELSMPENRAGFNFILKKFDTGVFFISGQLDSSLYIVYFDKEGILAYKTLALGT